MISEKVPRNAWPLGVALLLVGALAVTVIEPFGGRVTEPARAPGDVCAHAGSRWGEVSEADYQRALACLVNHERRTRGLRTLTLNARLDRAAERHALDMDGREYFAHTSPSGSTPPSRARAARYIPGEGRWKVGEDLAWSRGPDSTPSEVVEDWMQSRAHRREILTRSYRHIAIGTEYGSPGRGEEAGTVTIAAEFGYR